jgi:hypothetical protein
MSRPKEIIGQLFLVFPRITSWIFRACMILLLNKLFNMQYAVGGLETETLCKNKNTQISFQQ